MYRGKKMYFSCLLSLTLLQPFNVHLLALLADATKDGGIILKVGGTSARQKIMENFYGLN